MLIGLKSGIVSQKFENDESSMRSFVVLISVTIFTVLRQSKSALVYLKFSAIIFVEWCKITIILDQIKFL
jgi:hypothetical protein